MKHRPSDRDSSGHALYMAHKHPTNAVNGERSLLVQLVARERCPTTVVTSPSPPELDGEDLKR